MATYVIIRQYNRRRGAAVERDPRVVPIVHDSLQHQSRGRRLRQQHLETATAIDETVIIWRHYRCVYLLRREAPLENVEIDLVSHEGDSDGDHLADLVQHERFAVDLDRDELHIAHEKGRARLHIDDVPVCLWGERVDARRVIVVFPTADEQLQNVVQFHQGIVGHAISVLIDDGEMHFMEDVCRHHVFVYPRITESIAESTG